MKQIDNQAYIKIAKNFGKLKSEMQFTYKNKKILKKFKNYIDK